MAQSVRRGCALVAILLGVLYAWVAPPAVGPDGISYLDLADAFRRGNLAEGLNTLWSPLYPLLLAGGLRIIQPAPRWEFAAVSLVNLLVYLAALVSFDFLLREIIRHQRLRAGHLSATGQATLPEWAVWVVGYALFAHASLELIDIDRVTPDLLVAASVYLSAALLLATARQPRSWRAFLLLGLALGGGYLAKSPMFPIALVFLGVAGVAALRSLGPGDAARRLLVAVAAFGLVSGSLATAFLLTRGRLTLGDSGRLNYAWLINHLPYAHWNGRPAGFGIPLHPTRKVFDAPAVYEFASPIGGTYPPWFDPAYWNAGIKPRLDFKAHVGALRRSVWRILYDVVLRRQVAILTALLALALLAGRTGRVVREVRSFPVLVVPALAGLAMYSLIHVELRFVAPFITLTWLGILAGVSVSASPDARRAGEAILLAAAVGVMLPGVAARTVDLAANPRPGGGNHFHASVASGLHAAGVMPGDRIGVIGFSIGAYWARLARVRIVAEICAERPLPPWNCGREHGAIRDFWTAPPEVQQRVYAAFRQAGAKAIVAESVGDVRLVGGGVVLPAEWRQIQDTGYFILTLDEGRS